MQQWPVVLRFKKDCLRSLWSGDIWSTKNLCVFGNGVFTGSSCLFRCSLHSQRSPAVVLVPHLQKLEVTSRMSLQSTMSLQDTCESRSPSQKDKRCWAKAVSDENTHTLYFLFRISCTSLATVILLRSSSHCFFLSFSFFLWIELPKDDQVLLFQGFNDVL